MQNQIVEVFKNSRGCVYQSNRDRCFIVEFARQKHSLSVSNFYKLKKLINSVNLTKMANNMSKAYDIEIIYLPDSEIIYVLTLSEIVVFKELLVGANIMLELNSIIYERLYSISV